MEENKGDPPTDRPPDRRKDQALRAATMASTRFWRMMRIERIASSLPGIGY
jgi:hypothetical protein